MLASKIAAWTLRIVLFASFIYFGITKFTDPAYATNFLAWGFPQGFHYVTGALEIIGAFLILLPMTTFSGIAVLGLVLFGAVGTALLNSQGPGVVLPLAFIVLLAGLGWLRWRDRV